LVNAVLRRVGTQSPAASGGEPVGHTSHPDWLIKRWRDRFGPENTRALVAHNDTRPPLVLQPARWSAERLRQAFGERGVVAREAPLGLGLALESRLRVSDVPGYADGAFVVQDPAQARALIYAAVPPGALIWDACAAPGGKAAVLAQSCRVLASDRSRERLALLHDTAVRVAPKARLMLADGRRPPVRPGVVDAVWLDAPCSAPGTMARHPDARWRLSPRRLEALVRLQGELLEGVASVVSPGGLLVYSTCSLEPEENEGQVDAFLARHNEFGRTEADLFIFPPAAGTDGAYVARLRRAA
jgi:16S rRNA (cytosine967-C5)-methyltransferase